MPVSRLPVPRYLPSTSALSALILLSLGFAPPGWSQAQPLPPAMDPASGPPPGGFPPMNPPTSGTHFTAAIDVKDQAYQPDESVPTAVRAGKVSDQGASGVNIRSSADRFNGVYVHGPKASYTVDHSRILLSGKGTSDFSGVAAGALVSQGGTLVLKDVTIETHGVVSAAATATEHSRLRVYHSTLRAFGGPVPSGYVRRIGPGMMEPPTPLGITGTARATLAMDNSDSYYYDSTIEAQGWGALSTDATNGHVYVEANRCVIRTIKSGYGTYADGGAEVVINHSTMDTASYTGVVAGSGKITLNDVRAHSGGNNVMLHNVMGSTRELGTLTIRGGNLSSQNASISIKSANVDILIEHAQLTPANGDLLLAVINDDANATKTHGQPVRGTRAVLRDDNLQGNVLNLDTDRGMSLRLEHTHLTGIIRNVELALDASSSWRASGDSTITLAGATDLSGLDAPTGVTIVVSAGAGSQLQRDRQLASGGLLRISSGQ